MDTLQQRYAHHHGRKLDSFDQADDVVYVRRVDYDLLTKIDLDPSDNPFTEMSLPRGDSVFVARHNGNEYLVNTEGFAYCRYVAQLRLVD